MASPNKLTVKDRGWKKLMELGKQLEARPFVKVGVLGRNDDRPGDIFGNVKLAIVHEFGLGVPRRPFLRNTASREGAAWAKMLEGLARGLVRGKFTVPQALTVLGLRAANDAKRTIQKSLDIAPNAPATVRAKGSSRPLVDTGRLVTSIDFEVVAGGG